MIPLPHASNANNTDLLAQIILKKQEEERLAKQRNFELMNSAIQNSANAYGQLQQQSRAQQLAQMAAGGDRSALLQMGITPPDLKPKNSILLETPEHAEAISRAKTKGAIEGGKTPKSLEQIQAEAAARAAGIASVDKPKSSKDKQYDIKQWKDLVTDLDISKASSRSPLGVASLNNQRADRALTTLNDPKMVAQQLNAVSEDYAAIMKGGVPDISSQQAMSFQTTKSKIDSFIQEITGRPQSINQPEIVAKLRSIVNEIKAVDNKTIRDHFELSEFKHKDIISQNQQDYERLKKKAYSQIQGVADAPQDNGGGWKYLGPA